MQILEIDFSDRGANARTRLVESLRETGFAVVVNHSVDRRLLSESYRDWVSFFSSPEKMRFKFRPHEQTGYFPFQSENAKQSSVKDLKEFYHIYRPEDLPSTISNTATLRVREQMITIASELLTMIELALPSEVTSKMTARLAQMIEGSQQTLLRILHYPPLNEHHEPGAVRAAAHEDINLITILPAATEPGLEVLGRDGKWQMVSCDPGNLIVNVGDMLQLATDGYLLSTTHRVVNPSGEAAHASRYSMPLFLHPRPEVQLTPQRTAKDYLNERLRELGLIS